MECSVFSILLASFSCIGAENRSLKKTMISDDSVKTVGLLTIFVIIGKLIYNLIHFAYTTFVGRWLGHGIDLRKCGPWAGQLLPFILLSI